MIPVRPGERVGDLIGARRKVNDAIPRRVQIECLLDRFGVVLVVVGNGTEIEDVEDSTVRRELDRHRSLLSRQQRDTEQG